VIDKTGIDGRFNIHLDLSAAELGHRANAGSGDPDPADPYSAFDAVRTAVRKLGMRLEPTKGSGEFLIIDHVERPSEN
jgi:uncharacterized protein (TIGR03435 family)